MGNHCGLKGFPLDQCAKVTSAPPILEEIWCFQSGLVLHESHPYGENTSVLANCKPPTSIIQRKRAGPKGSAPVLLIIRTEKKLTALQITLRPNGSTSHIPGTGRRIQPSGWDAAGRPDKIDQKCSQHKVQAKFSKLWGHGRDRSYSSLAG